MNTFSLLPATIILLSLATSSGCAQSVNQGGIQSPSTSDVLAPFDIVRTRIHTEDQIAVFEMAVSANAGSSKPSASGQLAGSEVFSYVWPTSIDSYEVGFEKNAGILALAVTSHTDFDDTPLYDENRDNDPNNDGDVWHSHWVVLTANDSCGTGALAVVDIPENSKPRLPKTWPGLPLLLDSPGWDPLIANETVVVRIPFADIAVVEDATFDGVTAGLRVNESVHAPLLCVVNVMDIASGDLSFPGSVNN